MEEIVQLILDVEINSTDKDSLDLITRDLLDELRDVDLEYAELLTEKSIPEGGKSAEAITIGAIAIAILPAVLPKFIEFIQGWVGRRYNRAVKIKAQSGERILEIEYSPDSMSIEKLSQVVDTIIQKQQQIN